MSKKSTDLVIDSGSLLEQKIKDLAQKGLVFSQPRREGEYTLITASDIRITTRRVHARPVAALILGPQGLKVHSLQSPLRFLGVLIPIFGIVFYGSMLILHPPWKPNYNLFEEVRRLIETIRQKQAG